MENINVNVNQLKVYDERIFELSVEVESVKKLKRILKYKLDIKPLHDDNYLKIMRNLILENYKFPPGLSKSTHDIELVEKNGLCIWFYSMINQNTTYKINCTECIESLNIPKEDIMNLIEHGLISHTILLN